MTSPHSSISSGARIGVVVALLGVVATIATPELRCMLGLYQPRCPAARLADVQGGFSGDDAFAVNTIRSRFNSIEHDLGRMEHTDIAVSIRDADSASVTLYRDGGTIPKTRLRVYRANVRTSYQFYYQDDRLVFIYKTAKALDRGDATISEERFYFRNERMFRWLNTQNRAVTSSGPEYEQNARELLELARFTRTAPAPTG